MPWAMAIPPSVPLPLVLSGWVGFGCGGAVLSGLAELAGAATSSAVSPLSLVRAALTGGQKKAKNKRTLAWSTTFGPLAKEKEEPLRPKGRAAIRCSGGQDPANARIPCSISTNRP
jgi:hypothetical protein